MFGRKTDRLDRIGKLLVDVQRKRTLVHDALESALPVADAAKRGRVYEVFSSFGDPATTDAK